NTTVAKAHTQSLDDDPSNDRDVARVRVSCNPGVLAFASTSPSVAEGAGNASVAVTRMGGDCGAVSVQIDTSPGSAQAGADFTDTTAVLTWNDGDSANKTIKVPIVDDLLDENNETMTLSLSNANGAGIGKTSRTRLVITDDDASPRANFATGAQ